MKTKTLLLTTALLAIAACSNTADEVKAAATPQTESQITAAANEASLEQMKTEMGIAPEAAPQAIVQEAEFPINAPDVEVKEVKVEVTATEPVALIKTSTTKQVIKVAPRQVASKPKPVEPVIAQPEATPEPVQMASNETAPAEAELPQMAPEPEVAASEAVEDNAPEAPVAGTNDNDKEAAMPADPWTQILQAYTVKDGSLVRFDYSALSKNKDHMTLLGTYIDDLAGQKPSAMSRDEGLAYWANLYNALTVQVVAENWPVKSIKEIKSGTFTSGPWKRDIVTVEGKTLSLDGIEHDTMRATWDEPRIHYMVNCASVGCPNLMQRAWSAKTLEADLNAAAADYINSDRGGVVSGNSVKISSIFKWYKEDFGNNNSGIIAHMKQYATGDKKAALANVTKVSGDEYDWNVNAGSAPKDGMKKISAEKMEDLK